MMKKIYLFLFFVLGSVGVWAQVTLPHLDPINYTVGQGLQTQAGWTALNSGDDLLITSGNLSFPGLPASTGEKVTFAGAGIDAAKLFTQQTTGTVYYSFLLDVTALGSLGATGGYFTSFTEGTGTTFGATVWTRLDGAGYDIGINPRTTAANTVWTSGTTNLNTTVFVVISYQLVAGATNDIVKLWINPTPGATEPVPTLTATNGLADLANLNRILIRQDAAASTPFIEMDELRIGTTWADVTPTTAGTPNIVVSPTSLSGFSSLSAVPSAEQNYTVSGTDLTADIAITAPAGFEISPTTAPFTPTSPINLTPTAGTVAATTIYVRMNSATLGTNTGNITHTSAGSNDPDVALTGNVLAAEPTIQSTITIGAVTNSTVVVNFGGGNGARRILLAKLATAVDSDPVDGTTYTANANFGSGTQIGTGNFVVYDGVGNTQLVTGLTAGATYHFAIYEYNDGGTAGAENYLVPGGLGNATVATYSVPYVWIGLNGDWQQPLNWLPARLFPATNDSLLFISGLADVINNVPTQTVGYIGASLLTNTTLQASATGNTLTIGNLTGTDLFVEAGSSFNINTANALTLNLVTGATANISGSMTFAAGAHKLTAANAGAVIFGNGAVFTAGTGFTGNAFGTANLNSVIFANGSRYDFIAGSNPFGAAQPNSVVVFQTGSLFRVLTNLAASFTGRTYADFELDNAAYSAPATGGAPLSIDNLTITNGVLNLNLTGGISIKGNIAVAAGQTLTFTPASLNTLTFNGTTPQSITNAGTLTFAANEAVSFNNANGITLNNNITLNNLVSFTAGIVTAVNPVTLTLSATASVATVSNASFVNGRVSKIGNTPFVFPIGKTNTGPSATVNGYAAAEISNFIGGAVTDQYTAAYIRASGSALGPVTAIGLNHVSACDYWTLTRDAGASTVDITLHWNDAINNCTTNSPYVNNLASLTVAHFDGASWDAYGTAGATSGTTVAGTVTWGAPQSTSFDIFTIGSTDFNNPLPISINYFTGTKNNGKHVLNWKVTCVSTPNATLELQRSTDGRNYSNIYSIFATAVRCAQPFDYTDNAPAKGVNYYRLRMTDADGKVTYSSVVSLINGSKGIDVMNIAPNPIVNGNFNIKISTAENASIEFVITDMQGRVMQKQAASMIAGFNTIPMNVKNLAAGTYQLFGNSADGRTRVLRFVIQ